MVEVGKGKAVKGRDRKREGDVDLLVIFIVVLLVVVLLVSLWFCWFCIH